jgi:hypothetical protein
MEFHPSYFTNISCNGEEVVVEEETVLAPADDYYCGEEPAPDDENCSDVNEEEDTVSDEYEEEVYPSLIESLAPFINEVKRRLDSKDASLWFMFFAFVFYHLVIFYLFLFLVLLLIIGKKL